MVGASPFVSDNRPSPAFHTHHQETGNIKKPAQFGAETPVCDRKRRYLRRVHLLLTGLRQAYRL
jgi:hypothetical protein